MYEKVATDILAELYEVHHIFSKGQISSLQVSSTINFIAQVTQQMQKLGTEGKLAGMLFMNVKVAFDCLRQNRLIHRIDGLGVEEYLMRKMESVMGILNL